MNNSYKFLLLAILFIGINSNADAQLRRIYNEQQLIVLEQQGLLQSIDENQINCNAKSTEVYKRFCDLVGDEPKYIREKKEDKKSQ